jgi:putative copper export protein
LGLLAFVICGAIHYTLKARGGINSIGSSLSDAGKKYLILFASSRVVVSGFVGSILASVIFILVSIMINNSFGHFISGADNICRLSYGDLGLSVLIVVCASVLAMLAPYYKLFDMDSKKGAGDV